MNDEATNIFTAMINDINKNVETAEALINIMELAGDDVTDQKKDVAMLREEMMRYQNALNEHLKQHNPGV
ncbi:MAG: hypothetical protein PHW03_09425 [Eubacteriales bacterium]|nr:hypothetical protein [Eubacteriales bacterium]